MKVLVINVTTELKLGSLDRRGGVYSDISGHF